MSSVRKRIRCSKCNEELSYSAFKRHQNPLYCTPLRFVEGTIGSESSDNIRSVDVDVSQIESGRLMQATSDVNGDWPNELNSDTEDVDSWNLKFSDEESNTTYEEQDDETQVVAEMDLVDQELLIQEEDNSTSAAQGISCCESELPNTFSIDDHSTEVHVDNPQQSLSCLILRPLAISLIFFQLVYKISDRGIECILMLIHSLIKLISQCIPNPNIELLLNQLPKTIYKLKKTCGQTQQEFIKFAVCPRCSACYNIPNNTSTNITCSERLQYSDKICGTELLRKLKCGKKYKFIPKKVYVYRSVKTSLSRLFQRNGFLTDIEHWRSRVPVQNVMSDVYDGNIWKELSNPGQFLSNPYSLCLRLNIDWFRIYKHVNYSVGLIYLVVDNLPRHKRFNIDNIIIVGCIPGPKEPKLTVNPFLKPLVDELLELWNGIFIKTESIFGITPVRCMLTSISADIPATRKLCGFFSHNARRGCSKCLKEFEHFQFGSKPDYSGYDSSSWSSRHHISHMDILGQIKQAKSASEKHQLQRAWGVRYSELVRLPYLDLIRYHVVDPMHNLLLGTAKYTMSVWKEESYFSSVDYQTMQENVDKIRVPKYLGRIPHKVESQLSSLTADQWKNWVLVYSMPVLRSVLPPEHLQCWSLFVEACSLLLKPILTINDVTKGDMKIIQFCKHYELLYGKSKCTPNMHLHLHLKQCLLDYGPVQSFWCFPFERFNGVFESFQKNWICPELQIMNKFVNYQESVDKLSLSTSCFEWLNDIKGVTSSCQGSIQQTCINPTLLQLCSNYMTCPIDQIDATNLGVYNATSKICEKLFQLHEVEWIKNVYMVLYPNSKITNVLMAHDAFNEISICGERWLSIKARGNHSHSIIAYWPESVEGSSVLTDQCQYRAGEIQYFFHHTVGIIKPGQPEILVTHVFAYVHWYDKHPYHDTQLYPLKVYTNIKKNDGPSVFIPVSRIMNQCAELNTSMKFDFGMDNVLVLCPINRSIHV